MPSINQQIGTIIGAMGLFFWSLSAVYTVHIKSLPLFEILSIVFLISFIISAIKISVCRQWSLLRQPWYLWFIGIVGIYGNDIFFIEAFKYAPATHADLINYLWPIFVICFASLLPQENFSLKHFSACLLGLLGIYILLTNGQGLGGFKTEYLVGYGFALLDAMVWALYTLVARYHNKTPVEMVGIYCGFSALISLIAHFSIEASVLPSASQWLILVVMGLTTQGFAYFFWDFGVKKGDFKLLSILSYANPIFSVILLLVFGMAQPSLSLMLATLSIALAGFIGSLPNNRFKPKVSYASVTQKLPLAGLRKPCYSRKK